MEEQEVDKIFLALDLQPVLASHERKEPAHLTKEMLDASDKPAFQLSFAVLFGKLQKIEGVFILDRQLRVAAGLRRDSPVKRGLVQKGLFVGLVFDLMQQDVLGPAEFARHSDVEFAFQIILAAPHDCQMFRPTDFSNQWLEFCVSRVGLVELTHIPQILN